MKKEIDLQQEMIVISQVFTKFVRFSFLQVNVGLQYYVLFRKQKATMFSID